MHKIEDESKKLNRLLIIGLTTSLVFVCLIFFFYNEASTSSSEDAMDRVQEVSEQHKNAIMNQINGDFSTLVGISSLIRKDDLLDESKLLDRFYHIVQQNDFLRVSFTRTDGYAFMIDHEGNKSYQVDFRNREDIKVALEGNQNLSASFKDDISNQYVNCYAVPVYIENELVGAITAVHKSEHFYDMITEPIFGGNGQTRIVDKDGNLVIHLLDDTTSSMNLKTDINNQEDLDRFCDCIQGETSTVINVTMNGDKYICSIVPLGMNDWHVNTLVPMDYFHLGYNRLVMIISIVLLIIIVGFALTFFYIKKIMKDSRESIIQLAYYDSLTGIFNRNRYMDVVAELIDSKNSYVFILLDVSNFKFINETYGYESGNNLLIHIANVLKDHMRKNEVCFRDNADCFGMLLHYINSEALESRLNRIIGYISSYSFDYNEDYNIICNCGIKIIDQKLKNGKDIDMIFDRALLALEKAKGNHVSTLVYFNYEMEAQSQKRFKIENSMRIALENHEFQLYLQPKIDIESERVIGAEALVRWVVDDEVYYYPDEFIPIFEKNGFICELDLYMLEEVCLCLKNGLEKGYSMIPISVNQSKVLFYRMNYLDSLKLILERYHIDPSLIIIEVTETVTMENMERVKEVIKGLHELGFRVSMDDFGSGYSSLNVLQELEIDELKLDREFLMKSDHELKQKKVIESVIQLAKELNISTVSEGVETVEQLSYLKSIKCDTAQGYYYSKPIPYQKLMYEIYQHQKWKLNQYRIKN